MVREYIGARYVPKFMGAHDLSQEYEALCVVDNGAGTSYISKVPTPAGTPLTNANYWAVYGASSGAIINLQDQINDIKGGLYRTIYDYGYVSGNDITEYVQAFIDDSTAKSLSLQMDGNYFIDNLDLSNMESAKESKQFIKGANTNITGTGASQIAISGEADIESLYSAGVNQFPRQFIRTTNDDSGPYRVETNLCIEDHVMNANDPHYHWNILAISDLHSNAGGSNVCEYLQVRNHGDSSNWALCIEVVTDRAISGTERYSTIGIELLLKGSGDISQNGGQTVGLHVISSAHNANGFNMNYGILFESSGNNTTNGYRDAIHFRNVGATRAISFASTATLKCGIDLHEASIEDEAIYAGFEHPIRFDNWSVREAYTSGIKTLVFEDSVNNKVFELTHLETTTAASTTPAKYMRVFYDNTQYCIPLYPY